jgi:N-acetylneuraminic acid mutarotase
MRMNLCRASKALVFPILAVGLLIGASSVSHSIAVFASVSMSNRIPAEMAQQGGAVWVPAGSLADGRHNHVATLLPDGRVLVVGGIQERAAESPALASAEIYDPTSGTWNATSSLSTGRQGHTATLLADGRVLVVGGRNSSSGPSLSGVEIYDPTSESWSVAASLSVPRHHHTATRLPDGRVLVVGGGASASAEIYDPSGGAWSPTGSLNTPRDGHSATLFAGGRVLVVGGYYHDWLATAEIYDPASETWSETPLPLACHGVAHTATRLSDGTVLLVGGACGSGTPGIRDDAEVYDPATSTWTAIAALPKVREGHTATLLPDGTVLVVGGPSGTPPRFDSALIYDPTNDVWYTTGSLATGRRSHTATLLDDGRVLAVGGRVHDTYLASAELYQGPAIDTPTPTNTPTNTPTSTPTNTPTSTPTSTPLPLTKEPLLGRNLNPVLTSVLASVICVAAIIGAMAVVWTMIRYVGNVREG